MNFYKRYVGDIQRDTGHLSLAEFGAYDRLLDHYYATEMPLPADFDSCCRIARAMTAPERKAVESILKQYFKLTDDGYSQGRTEKEIADAQPAMVSARLNGQKGGRPKKAENNNPNKTEEKPNGFSSNNPNDSQGESSPEPEPFNELSNSESNCNLAEQSKNITPTQKLVGEVMAELKAIGFNPFNPTLPEFIALIEAGATPEEFANTAIEFKGTDKFKPGYLFSTMIGRRQDAAKLNLHKGPLPASTSREAGRQVAASSIFTPENTQHLQGNEIKTIEVDHEPQQITA